MDGLDGLPLCAELIKRDDRDGGDDDDDKDLGDFQERL